MAALGIVIFIILGFGIVLSLRYTIAQKEPGSLIEVGNSLNLSRLVERANNLENIEEPVLRAAKTRDIIFKLKALETLD